MKIICQKCNKSRGCKKTTASFQDQKLEIPHETYDTLRQIVCDKCRYVADQWYYDSKNKEIGEI